MKKRGDKSPHAFPLRKKSRGQMKLSFNMIFSLILIVVFLGFGIFAITKFLGMQKATQILNFKTNLQEDVDEIWRSSKGSQEISYTLPSSIKEVCFVDFSKTIREEYGDLTRVNNGFENLAFFPVGSGDGNDATKINHINLEQITLERNPYCVQVKKGKVSMTLSKNYGDALVLIS